MTTDPDGLPSPVLSEMEEEEEGGKVLLGAAVSRLQSRLAQERIDLLVFLVMHNFLSMPI